MWRRGGRGGKTKKYEKRLFIDRDQLLLENRVENSEFSFAMMNNQRVGKKFEGMNLFQQKGQG